MIKAGFEFPELQNPDEETAEEAVRRFIGHYREVYNDLALQYQNLAAAHQLVLGHEEVKATLKERETELHATQNLLRACSTDLDDEKKEAFKMRQKHSEQYANLERETNALRKDKSSLKEDLERQRRAAAHTLETEKKRWQTWCDGQIQKARQDEAQRQGKAIKDLETQRDTAHWKWVAHVEELKSGHDTRLTKLRLEFDRLDKEQDDEHDRKMRFEQDRYDKMVTQLRGEIAQLNATTEEERVRLQVVIQQEQAKVVDEQKRRRKELKEQESMLVQRHTQENYQLRSANEELKQDLFDRKHFKGLRDRDLTGLFTTIVGQVREFSNLDWDPRRESEWPFAEHQLLDIHRHNIRKLKKQLLQNTIWILLYNHIFSSPFRIMGIEARDFDSDWVPIHAPSRSSKAPQ